MSTRAAQPFRSRSSEATRETAPESGFHQELFRTVSAMRALRSLRTSAAGSGLKTGPRGARTRTPGWLSATGCGCENERVSVHSRLPRRHASRPGIVQVTMEV